jgi:hypothetical protein
VLEEKKDTLNEKPVSDGTMALTRKLPVPKQIELKKPAKENLTSETGDKKDDGKGKENGVVTRVDAKDDGKAVSGGLLYLLRDIGAAFLWLFIGEKGWKAGNYALAVGSWIISTSIGLVLYVRPAGKLDPYICFLVIPGALLTVAFILNKLNESIPTN